MTQQAGWYDDPQDESGLRYWDGVQWTNHTSPKRKPDLDRAGSGNQQGDQAPYGQGQQAPGGHGQQGYGQQGGPGDYGQQSPYAGQAGQSPYQQGGWGQQMPGGGYAGAYGGPTTPDGQPLAGWWMRLLARIIDAIVTTIVFSVIALTLFVPDLVTNLMAWFEDTMQAAETGGVVSPAFSAELAGDFVVFGLSTALMYLAYEILMLKFLSATLGKLATGLRVRLREQPGPLPWSAVVVRALVWSGPNLLGGFRGIGTLASLFIILNGLWPLWDGKNQALHDKAAKTNVVKRRT